MNSKINVVHEGAGLDLLAGSECDVNKCALSRGPVFMYTVIPP